MGFLDTLWKGVQSVFGGGPGGIGTAIGNVGKGIGSAVPQIGKAAQGVGKSLGSFGQSAMKQFAPKALQGMMPNSGRAGGQISSQLPMSSFSPMADRMGPSYSGATPPTGFNDNADASPASKGFNLMDIFKGGAGKVLGGAGVMGLGQMFGGSPKHADFNTQAMQNYQNYNTGKLPSNVEDMINRTSQINEDQATKQLRDVYKNARPGTDYTTDSAYQRDLANLQRTQTLNRSDAQAQALMGFSQQELSRAQDLAQKSIEEIMFNTGMDAQEAQSIKEMFGNVGGAMISSGLGLDQYNWGNKKKEAA